MVVNEYRAGQQREHRELSLTKPELRLASLSTHSRCMTLGGAAARADRHCGRIQVVGSSLGTTQARERLAGA